MVCPICFSAALSGPHRASNLATRRLITMMECSHCHSVFDPYEPFGAERVASPRPAAA